ncbi:UNVERIFIED_CONTAM: hypothetical protein FKN15_010682 [Acipenser sinensis]
MKDGMLRCLQGVDSEALKTSSRPEWPAVVHNLCFLHSAVRLRAASGGAMGWNSRDTMMFGNQQFMDALQVLTEEFRDRDPEAEGRGVSWTGIRYLLSEVIYGSNVIDESDRISLASLVDLWISSTATKKDYDLTKLKYRVPAAFFIPGSQLSSLLQALDSVPRNSLDVPEAVSMHSAPEMRDPPQEGMFVYGIYLWGVSWHKTEAELLDAPPRRGPVPLPVIHLHCMPRAEKASLAEATRTTDTYQCPVYTSSTGPREPVLHLDIHKESVPATRWALRGMKATLQPF